MRSVKYKEFEIPIFDAHYYDIDKSTDDLYVDRGHSCYFSMNVSFLADSLSGFCESVLENLNNEHVVFKMYDGDYKIFKILDSINNQRYQIASCESIVDTINVVNYNFTLVKSEYNKESVIRCIKIENLLNHC